MGTSINIVHKPNNIEHDIAAILAKRITQRSGSNAVGSPGDVSVFLEIENDGHPESYSIIDAPNDGIKIVGSDGRGLLYGVGKFLRTSSFDNGFVPSTWRGSSSPDCDIRGIYMAVHFNNFYEAAPADEVELYLQELALWGANSIAFHFPPQQFDGFNDPAAKCNIEKIRVLMQTAKRLGLDVGLIECPNIGFRNAPKEYYYQPFPDDLNKRGSLGTLLCPSIPESRKYLLKLWDGLTDEFLDIGLDFFVSWPYDEGGCGCDMCWPWGTKGFLDISKDVSGIVRSKFAGAKFILSTWLYDTPDAGEWEGLSRSMADDKWVDYIMADAHEDFPRYPLDHPVPGNLSLINFPEISMWGQGPWGGYGANPLPARFQRLWSQASDKLAGGFPYSEGIFEDINKVICLQLYWDKDRQADNIIREYISSQFSPGVVDKASEAIDILESNHCREQIGENSAKAWELIKEADDSLCGDIRNSWRWRIIYLRALIDYEMFKTGGRLCGSTLKNSFAELTDIYYAQEAFGVVHPPIVDE
ncbi:glycoside hydrolase family 20 zincin-like fold domain-containing protein [bacterium]|nr:glycoside hydrolase family 20 zincin-like fold domain-containing protein [bacterium]